MYGAGAGCITVVACGGQSAHACAASKLTRSIAARGCAYGTFLSRTAGRAPHPGAVSDDAHTCWHPTATVVTQAGSTDGQQRSSSSNTGAHEQTASVIEAQEGSNAMADQVAAVHGCAKQVPQWLCLGTGRQE